MIKNKIVFFVLLFSLNACGGSNNTNSQPTIDSDNDGISDNQDNCPNVANVDQKDTNSNNIGDACEPPINTNNSGATYFIRTDGGTTAQCDGLHDKAYDAQSNQCAWNHPWLAIPPKESSNTTDFKGGDTLIIGPGEYAYGYGAVPSPGVNNCIADNSPRWNCLSGTIPSGTASAPTQILGKGYDSDCPSPPQLWGTYRTQSVLNLQNSNHIVLRCLDITDHAQCSRFHKNPALKCDDDIGVVEGYSYRGISASDSSNVMLKDVKIHGLDTGVYAGRIQDWTLENVVIRANKFAGWDGDIGDESSNKGRIHFKNGRIEWSGCIEPYPAINNEPIGCISQDNGGYGDGLGTGATAGNWIFENFSFLKNVSDGLDLLYLIDPGKVTIKGGRYEGNAGNALKVAGGGHQIENVEIIGNCGFFKQGNKWPSMVNNCRAQGNALSLGGAINTHSAPNPTAITHLDNVSVWAEGDCAIVYDHTANISINKSVFHGAPDFLSPSELACFAYSIGGTNEPIVKNTIIYNFKNGCGYGINAQGVVGHCDTDPKFISGGTQGSHTNPTQNYDLNLSDTSPFKNHSPALGFHSTL